MEMWSDLAATEQNQTWMDEVLRAFAISDIQSSPIGDERSMYAICVRSSMIYGSETRPLVVDVGLKFEKAEMQMIRWMCGISMKYICKHIFTP